ncbi:MAG: histidinol-phosphate transaminase [Oligoflexales bacterium]
MQQINSEQRILQFPEQLVRKDLQGLSAYSAAKPPNTVTKIKLNANESPFPVNLNSFPEVNRYPKASSINSIRAKLAPYLGLREEQIFLSRGSGEGIDLICRIFCEAREDAVVVSSPSFSLYENYARIQGAEVFKYQTDELDDFYICPKQLIAKMPTQTKIIFLCSPNNPTGQSIREEDLLFLLEHTKGTSMVLVDEAYIEFSKYPSFSRMLDKFPNLIVLRTFSKAWSLAGLRMGCILAHPQLIIFLDKIKAPYAFSSPSLDTFVNYLDQDWETRLNVFITHNKQEREGLLERLNKIPVIEKVFPSDANFIMCKVKDARKIEESLTTKGILVRVVSNRYLRLTIGTKEENHILCEALIRLR